MDINPPTDQEITMALSDKFPELGTVMHVENILLGERLAYRIQTDSGDYFIKNTPNSSRAAKEENLHIQRRLYDIGLPVAKTCGIMDIGGQIYTVEEFRSGKHIERPELPQLTQVVQTLAKLHLATEQPQDTPMPEMGRFTRIVEKLTSNFAAPLSRFEAEGLPRNERRQQLTQMFMEKLSEYGMENFVENSSHFPGENREASLNAFREVAESIAEMIVEGNILDYLASVPREMEARRREYAPYLHISQIHGDPNPENMLYDDDRNLKTMIDFEYSKIAPSYLDLSAAIGTQFRFYEEGIDWDKAQKMVSAYNQERPLSPQEVELLPLEMHSRNVLIASIKLLQFSQLLTDSPPHHLNNPLPRLQALQPERKLMQEVIADNRLSPTDKPHKLQRPSIGSWTNNLNQSGPSSGMAALP